MPVPMAQLGATNMLRSLLTYLTVSVLLLAISGRLAGAAQGATMPAQQAADQDCAKIKQDIEQLQQDLTNLSVEMQRLTDVLNQTNNDISKAQTNLRAGAAVNSSFLNQEARGQLLDALARLMSIRKDLEQKLEDDAKLMQAIKDEIADLLNKLANCAPPSTTETPKGTPGGQPLPPSTPPLPPSPVSPNPPPPQTAAPVPQAPAADCEKIKQDIQQLQQDLANVSLEMQRLTDILNQTNNDISKAQTNLRAGAAVNSSFLNQEARGQLLDALARLMSIRKDLEQKLEDDATMMQEIKNEIADLLNKLANCPPPSTTEPPKPEPPKENKQVGMVTPTQPGPTKPLVSVQLGGGIGFSNLGGTSGERAAFLNSFLGGTFSTSANTFAGNIGTSLGIGPMVFDFNAWRANGNDSTGSGSVPGGGTDTAHITQQFGGITLTGGVMIPLGHNFFVIPRAGGNFWQDNIDTSETVTTPSGGNTSKNSRSPDGTGWTAGAALQWDFTPRWSAIARWDYLPMRNAGVNVHLNQFSTGVMFRLFGVPK